MPKKKHKITFLESMDLALKAVHAVTRNSEPSSTTTKRSRTENGAGDPD